MTVALAAFVGIIALVVNLYPFRPEASTGLLVALFLPVVLWFVIGVASLVGVALIGPPDGLRALHR